MGNVIGFEEFRRFWKTAWEGPAVLAFQWYANHTKTTRYQCSLETRTFDLYLPHFLLPDGHERPREILVALGKSPEPLREAGFSGQAIPPRVTSDTCEFDFVERMVNSCKYQFEREGQAYNLYVPNEVLEGKPPPERIFLRVGVP